MMRRVPWQTRSRSSFFFSFFFSRVCHANGGCRRVAEPKEKKEKKEEKESALRRHPHPAFTSFLRSA